MSNYSQNIAHEGSGNKMSPKEAFFKYLVYLPLFILCIAISITVAYLYIRYTVPLYRSSISVIINSDKGQRSGANLSFDDIVTGRRSVNLANEIEVIKSTSMMTRVVQTLGLNLQYYGEGKIKKSELYNGSPVMAEVISIKDSASSSQIMVEKGAKGVTAFYDGKKHVIRNGETITTSNGTFKLRYETDNFVPEYKYYVVWLPVKSAAAALASSLEVRQLSKEASILRISIVTQIPQQGRDVLNKLVKEYDQLNIEDKNRIADNTLRFIDDRMDVVAGELNKVEGSLQVFKEKTDAVDLGRQSEAGFADLTKMYDALNEQEAYIQVIQMLKDYVSNPHRKFQLVPSALGINDATLSSLIATYNGMQLNREEELKTKQPSHPDIKTLESQVEKVRTSILENLNNIQLAEGQERLRRQREYDISQLKLRRIPAKERELLEIERQQGIKEKLFLYLLQRREESAISRASAVGNTMSIDEAVSGGPVSPNSSNIYRMAFLIGLVLPVAFIYMRDLLNDKVVTRSDLLKQTSTPIIGEVAHHASMTRKLVVGLKDRSILAEQFRILRTNLQFLLAHAPAKNPVVLVTSSIAGEGKTFCSMNMAAVWAVAGKKTVILELDLRKPKISKALGLQRDVGLTNFILGNAAKEDLPQPNDEVPNLYIIGAGPIPPNPSEMIMDGKMDELFTWLRANFDIIIIDSAPIGLVSDSKILARFADATLYVVRQRYTVKKQIALVEDLYQQKILPNMGLIVNDVKIGGANSYYGYGYGYGYGYSYNYNYSYSYGEQEKKSFLQKVKDVVGL